MDVVGAGELYPPFLSPLQSWSAPSHGHDSLAQCAAEMVDSPAVFGLACRRGDMDTRGAGTRGVAVAAAWRTCPETCRLSTNLAKGSFPPVRKYPTVFRIKGSS